MKTNHLTPRLTHTSLILLVSLALGSSAALGTPGFRLQTLDFIPNLGQWPGDVDAVSRGGGVIAAYGSTGFALFLPGRADRRSTVTGAQGDALVRFHFEGATQGVAPEPREPRSSIYNLFLGSHSGRWRSGVPCYESLSYAGIYDGVDVVFRESRNEASADRLEYDLVLEPHADTEAIVIRCEGALGLRIDAGGALVVETVAGELRKEPPVSWQVDRRGERHLVVCRYRLLGADRFGFTVDRIDPGLRLVIDPVVSWGHYLGGAGADTAWQVKHHDGVVVVSGHTLSPDFPRLQGDCESGVDPHRGARDAYIARFDAVSGELLSTTLLGGSSEDDFLALDVDDEGRIYASGWTLSRDLPVTNGSETQGSFDAFIARFSPDGCELEFSSYLGGTSEDKAHALVAGEEGIVYIAGHTLSIDFPATRGEAFQDFHQGGGGDYDGILARIDTNAGEEFLTHATYLGGSRNDFAMGSFSLRFTDVGIDLVEDDVVVVVGNTDSPAYPSSPDPEVFSPFRIDERDMLITMMDLSPEFDGPPEARHVRSTFVGGSREDVAWDVEVAPDGSIWVVGFSWSRDLSARLGARENAGGHDVLVVALDSELRTVQVARLLGGWFAEAARDIDIAPDGRVAISGFVRSDDFPTTPDAIDAFMEVNPESGQPGQDGFVAILDAEGQLEFSTFVGGTVCCGESLYGVAFTTDGSFVAVGGSPSPDVPGLAGRMPHGGGDAFVVSFRSEPPGGLQMPGDTNQDGVVNVADPVDLLGFVFLGTPPRLPCGDGTNSHPGNLALVDFNGDDVINLSDPVAMLNWLFLGGASHVFGLDCVRIVECPDVCAH